MSTWDILGGSVTGYGKQKENLVCQDASSDIIALDYKFVAIADGVSSCCYSDAGAHITVNTVAAYIHEFFKKNSVSEVNWEQLFINAVESAREKLLQRVSTAEPVSITETETRPAEIEDFACTLIITVVTDKEFAAYFIGDGFLITSNTESHSLVVEPHDIENSYTTTIIDEDYLDSSKFIIEDIGDIDAVFVLTDGLQNQIINIHTLKLREEFFDRIIKLCSASHIPKKIKTSEILSFMDLPTVNHLGDDDDKTLVVMCKQVKVEQST